MNVPAGTGRRVPARTGRRAPETARQPSVPFRHLLWGDGYCTDFQRTNSFPVIASELAHDTDQDAEDLRVGVVADDDGLHRAEDGCS